VSASGGPRLRDALFDVPAISTADWARASPLLRWMIDSRASVLAMTLFASLFGGLLALPWSLAATGRLLLVTLALLLAHATNNLLNDHVDHRLGLDRDICFRARYGAQPLSQGLMGIAAHRRMLALTGSIALLLALGICLYLGGPAYWLASAGAVLLLVLGAAPAACCCGRCAGRLVVGARLTPAGQAGAWRTLRAGG
jgi:1,4-dihydroxy-2-naphthoate octaprenyltransferase